MIDFAVVACFYSGGVHLQITPHHLSESRFFGTVFLLDGAFFIAIAAWLSIRQSATAWRAAGSLAAMTTLAYVVSRTVGIPGMHEETWDVLGLTTTALQVAVAGVAVAMIGIGRLMQVHIGRVRMLAGTGLLVLVTGTTYAFVPAAAVGPAPSDAHGVGVVTEVVDPRLVEMEPDDIAGNAAIPARG
jgi:hypothetical protein